VLTDLVTDLARRYGDRPAFGHLGSSISFTELDVLSRRFAGWLQHRTDLQAGDRIAIQLPNLMQYPVVLFGALRAGLVVVNTNPLYTVEEIQNQFSDAGVRALVVYEPIAGRALSSAMGRRLDWVISTKVADLHTGWRRFLLNAVAALKGAPAARPSVPARRVWSLRQVLQPDSGHYWRRPGGQPTDLALLQYTGGTTGPAKGAMLSHASLLANVTQLRQRLEEAGLDGPQRVMQPLPLYHIYSFTLVLALLATGSYIELIPDPRNLRQLSRAFERVRPTLFAGINPLFISLCQHAEFTQLDFGSLRLTISGGMALTESAARRWQEVTGSEVIEGYGLTECSPVVSVNRPGANRPGTTGMPLPGTEVRIVGDEGEVLPFGESGEIQVRGPQLMLGYWHNPEQSEQAFSDGWLRTGDIGQLDEDGAVKIIDRRKEMINVSGFKVYPSELENVISAHPDILECAVIGVPDESSGEAIKLYVVSNNPRLSAREVREYCRERLTSYKVPRSVEFCDDLPRNAIGKVQRRQLHERALQELQH